MRSLNRHLNGRGDLAPFDYDGFVEYFFQIAYFIYTKPPFDMSFQPPVETLKALIKQFQLAAK